MVFHRNWPINWTTVMLIFQFTENTVKNVSPASHIKFLVSLKPSSESSNRSICELCCFYLSLSFVIPPLSKIG